MSGAAEGTERRGAPVGAILALVAAVLAIVVATSTAYLCGLTALAYGAWIVPAVVGLGLTLLLVVGAVTGAILAISLGRGRKLASVALALCVLVLGGLYAGCRKGLHDADPSSARSGTTSPSASQLEDERERVRRGEDVGASWRAPAIELDGATLTVNRELVAPMASLPTEPHVLVVPLTAHLGALHDHWTKIHPGVDFVGAPTVKLAPSLSAALTLDVLATLAEAGFVAATVSAGRENVSLRLASPVSTSFDVVTFEANERRLQDVTTWLLSDACSVIMVRDGDVDPEKLPTQFHGEWMGSEERPNVEQHVMVTPRVDATAADLTALLAKVMASRVMTARRAKLRFAWTARECPRDGKFGHAN